MVKFTIKSNIKFPNIKLQDILLEIAERIIIPDMQRGIDERAAIDGGMLPANDPKTVKRKGHDRPLIDTGSLRAAFVAQRRGKGKVLITLADNRKDIGGFLQIEGIRTKKGTKFYNFFGISKDAEDAAIAYMEKKIDEAIASNFGIKQGNHE
jgi:ABC-type tungstate transport system permease subunit